MVSKHSDGAVLDVLGDAVSRSILAEGLSSVVTAGTLSECLDVSTTTVYRRLNRLEALGLIREVTAPPMEPSSETGYRTTVRALVVSLSSEGVDLDWSDSELQAALSVLLGRIEVTEATFSFEDGTVDATLSMEEATLHELQEGFQNVRRDESETTETARYVGG